MPACSTGRKDDTADATKLPGGHVQAAEHGGRFTSSQPPTARIDDRIRLLADLLQHVMGVSAKLNGVGLPVDPVDSRSDLAGLSMPDLEAVGRQANDLAVLQK